MHRVFVYGTLRQGFDNHRLLENATFIGSAKTKQHYTMYASGIPYVNKTIPTHNIVGEIYEVTDEELKNLDSLEGYNPNNHESSWYKREIIPVVKDNEESEAFIYFNDFQNDNIVEHGDYTNNKFKY